MERGEFKISHQGERRDIPFGKPFRIVPDLKISLKWEMPEIESRLPYVAVAKRDGFTFIMMPQGDIMRICPVTVAWEASMK